MQVEIKIDDSCIEPRVIIITDKVNDEINDILNTLSSKTPEIITGFYNDLAEILSPDNIIHIYRAFTMIWQKSYPPRTLSVSTRRAARPLLRSARKNISSGRDYTSLRNS